MKKYLARWHFLVAILFFTAAVFTSYVFLTNQAAAQTNPANVSGFAWSSNIGWVNFKGVSQGANPSFYGVKFSPNQSTPGGNFSGYAWSSGAGWIRFEKINGEIAPDGGNSGVILDADGVTVVGWARACSVFLQDCWGSLKLDSARGGWDGWIKMSGDWDGDGVLEPGTTPISGLTADNYVRKDGNQLKGFAWGADVVGWVDFCPNDTNSALGPNACVSIATETVQCKTTATEASEDDQKTFVLNQALIPPSVNVYWKVTNPVNLDYVYEWEIDGTKETLPSGAPVSLVKNYNAPREQVTGIITVTDAVGSVIGQASCAVTIEDAGKKTLRIELRGDGEALQFSSVNMTPSVGSSAVCSGNNACSYILDTDTGVGLVAMVTNSPVDAGGAPYITFKGWVINNVSPGSGCINPGDPNDCSFGMTDDVFVTAYFDDSRVNAAATFGNPSPDPIRINAHDPGDSAISPKSSFNVIVEPGDDINVCVASVDPGPNTVLKDANGNTNAGPFGFIEQIIAFVRTNFEPSSRMPDCMLTVGGDTTLGCGGDSRTNCIQVTAGATQDVLFQIKIYDRLWELNLGSPYKIKFEARDLGTGLSLADEFLNFRYQVPDITPR